MIRFLLFFLFVPMISAFVQGQNIDFSKKSIAFDKPLTSIAFGSCNNQKKDQGYWANIADENPDLWIWSGDIIYADTEDMRVKASEYQKQKVNPDYQKFLGQVPVLGIYDDHDYGVNDACKTYPMRSQSRDLLLDFLDVPTKQPVRNREGAYQSYTVGPDSQSVKIILLDTRYFRDELEKNPEKGGQRFLQNKQGDVLGYDQWKWLERELKDSKANVHIIVTSIQLVPEEHYFEKWSNFPAARHKFFKLLAKTNPACPILISGDRHIAEISMVEIPDLDFPLYEVTSSGLTHARTEKKEEPNKYRVGDLMPKLNYGMLKIDWSTEVPSLTAEIKGIESDLLQECQID